MNRRFSAYSVSYTLKEFISYCNIERKHSYPNSFHLRLQSSVSIPETDFFKVKRSRVRIPTQPAHILWDSRLPFGQAVITVPATSKCPQSAHACYSTPSGTTARPNADTDGNHDLPDRVSRVIQSPGGFTVEHDPVRGDLYLYPDAGTAFAGAPDNLPAPAGAAAPVTLYLGTEQGFTYRLSLTVVSRDSAQILIRNAAVAARAVDRVRTVGGVVRLRARRYGAASIGQTQPRFAARCRISRIDLPRTDLRCPQDRKCQKRDCQSAF